MPKVNCALVGCSSSIYGINSWKKECCLEHGCCLEHECS